MYKPIRQTVYLPVKVEDELIPKGETASVSFDNGSSFSYEAKGNGWKAEEVKYTHWLKPQEALVFTPEQLNEYTSNVIKQTLEAAAENVETVRVKFTEDYEVDKQSITNTFDETFNKFK